MAMLGHLDTIDHLAGVALASVLFDYLYWSFGFPEDGHHGTDGAGLWQKRLGCGPSGTLAWSYSGLGLSVLVLLSHEGVAELGFWMLQGGEGVEQSGRLYFDARIIGAPAVLVNYVLIGWLLGA